MTSLRAKSGVKTNVGPRGPRNAIIAWTYVDSSKRVGADAGADIEHQRAGRGA